MKHEITLDNLPAGYEVSGIGVAPEEDSLVVMSSEAIKELRKQNKGFFTSLFSGPLELSGTGADSKESGFTIQELVERGIRR